MTQELRSFDQYLDERTWSNASPVSRDNVTNSWVVFSVPEEAVPEFDKEVEAITKNEFCETFSKCFNRIIKL